MCKALTALFLLVLIPAFLLADQQDNQIISKSNISNPETAVSDGEKGACGDPNDDFITNMMDIMYLYGYIFGGAEPIPLSAGNVDNAGRVNIADANLLNAYIYIGGVSLTCSDTTQTSLTTSAGNGITIGCPPYTPYPGNDSVAIPVYIDNIVNLRGISLGFYYPSTDIEISSINTTGSVAPSGYAGWSTSFNAANNKVLVGWMASMFPALQELTTQSNGLLFNLNATILSGPVDQSITLDTAFYSPAGDVMFVTSSNTAILPEFTPCEPATELIVTNTNSSGDGSLYWAITEANSNIGLDTITFDISGTIAPSTDLPPFIDDSTVILGSTAPGGAHSVILDGTGLGALNAFTVASNNNIIEGLTIMRFDDAGVRLNGDENIVSGCHINVTADGLSVNAGLGYGVYITGNSNIIGGPAIDDLNLIMGGSGVDILVNGGKYNEIYNNYFGLDINGASLSTFHSSISLSSSADSNYVGRVGFPRNYFANCGTAIGIMISSYNWIENNTIGLSTDMSDTLISNWAINVNAAHNTIGPDNIIAGADEAIALDFGADSNVIIGNTIVSANMNGIRLGNTAKYNTIGGRNSGEGNVIIRGDARGIDITGCDSNLVIGNQIGGSIVNPDDGNAEEGLFLNGDGNIIDSNVIAYNGENGITLLAACQYNSITRNEIYMNDLMGIDLGDDGITTNDFGDGDTGPNDLLNFPEIDSVFMNPDSSYTVWGITVFDSTRIEFFIAHPAEDSTMPADPLDYGEAYEFIGRDTANIWGLFEFDIPNTYAHFSSVTMTATDTFGNTSEFSPNFVLTPSPLMIVAYSPVNLKVINPAGDSVGKDGAGLLFNSIGDFATYDEIINDSVTIFNPIIGNYIIIVIPEDGAPPGALYSVGIRIDGSTQCIQVQNHEVPASGEEDTLGYFVEESYHYDNGDANDDNVLNLLDILCIIDCLYGDDDGDQCCPDPYLSGDANCDLELNLIDILYLISNKYDDPPGPAPCDLENK